MISFRNAGLIAALLGATALSSGPGLAQETAETAVAASPEAAAAETAPVAEMLSEDELDQLFSPVALYPDALLAQILLATTYPIDLLKADRFITKNADLTPEALADAVAGQDWPESVKGLAAGFPELIGRMAEHIDWTEQVGNVIIAQTDDSLASLQRLRAQAKLNGYLEDNAAMNVEETVEGDISISSADPAVVYVPQYTETVYTTPAPANPYYVTDDDDWDDYLAAGAIVFGGAILVDAIFDDDNWDDGWGDYWHGDGNGGNNQIDWDGDVNIDNGINIGNGVGNGIGNGDGNFGDGDFGGGDHGGLGGAVAGGIAGGVAGGALNRPNNDLPGVDRGRLGDVSDDRLQGARDGNFNPTDASRDAAREKIKNQKAAGTGVATLPAAGGKNDRVGRTPTAKPGTDRPKAAAKPASRPAAAKPKVAKPKTASRPTASRPTAKKAPAYKPSSGSRARSSSARGGSSRSGGRR